MQRFVIMGVSGCGKSTVGATLAERFEMTFFDGDDLHPKANIDKMSRGDPLNDADRKPWLAEVGRTLARAKGPMVIGCSALKRAYRDLIRNEAAGPVRFIHLTAPKAVLAERMLSRRRHFMPISLLDSQFDDLEHLEGDEMGIEIDIDRPIGEVVREAETYIREVKP